MTERSHFTERGDPIWGIATQDEHVEHEKKRLAGRCIHFNGTFNKECKAGVVYSEQEPLSCVARWQSQRICAFRVFPEGEALDNAAQARVTQITASLEEMKRRYTAQECVQCGKTWTAQRQVGPCIYNLPCGCRQGQGRLKKKG